MFTLGMILQAILTFSVFFEFLLQKSKLTQSTLNKLIFRTIPCKQRQEAGPGLTRNLNLEAVK